MKSLQRKLGYADRQRIDQYLESIREVEKRLDDRDAILDRGRPKFDEEAVRIQPSGKNGMQEHLELMMDLIALAFQTDMTRVVTHSLGGEAVPNYSEYQAWAKETGAPTRGTHDYHHKGSGNRGADNPDTKLIGVRDRLFCACLARLMDKLDAIEASDGTLLDHTTLLMGGSQISSHSGSSFPMLLAGGKRLGFKHGQHLKWKRDEKVRLRPISHDPATTALPGRLVQREQGADHRAVGVIRTLQCLLLSAHSCAGSGARLRRVARARTLGASARGQPGRETADLR